MLGIILRWVINALTLLVTSQIVPGIRIDSFGTALLAALVLGILNALLRPLLLILTLPVNILTLGLFTFVVNGVMLKLASDLVGGFHVDSFGSAVLGALVLALISFLLSIFVSDSGRITSIVIESRGR
jgi:putative membrane protein